MIVALIFACLMNFVSWWFSDKIVLWMYRAKPLIEIESPGIYKIISRLSQQASLPMPRIYLIPVNTPNAFATGRDPKHAVVAVTDGILRLLNEDEIEGVLAHELAHVKNRDILISSIVATVAGAIFMLANMAKWAAIFGGRDDDNRGSANIVMLLVIGILAPICAMLIQLAISRSREYHADESGSFISKKPLALASALKKLSISNQRQPIPNANPTTAHLFIVNPLSAKGLMSLFSTHPMAEDRIARLEALAKKI